MKFSIDTKEMQKISNKLGIVAKMNTTEIPGRILIEATETGVRFLASASPTVIEVTSKDAEVEKEGKVVVLYSKLRAFISSFLPWDGESGAKTFDISLQGNNLVLKVVNLFAKGKKTTGRLKLPTFDAYTIAEPTPFGTSTFILNSSIVKTAVDKVIYAINPNEPRRYIQGMNLTFDPEFITFAGTNGFMLSEYKIKNISDFKDGNYIISYSFILGLKRLIKEEDQLFFELDQNNIKVRLGNTCYWGRLIVGNPYPDYASELDKFSSSIDINKDILFSSLRPFIDVLDADDNYRIRFELSDGKLCLTNDNAEFIYDEVIAHNDNFAIDINGHYLLSTIDAIKDDQVVIRFSDSKGLLIFDSVHFKDQKALITPIQFRG